MKTTILSAVPLLASIAKAAPLAPRDNIDATVLNFALTLEHLENHFYSGALAKFSEEDFKKAGYGGDYYKNLKYIAYDESQHVELLSGALKKAGVTPVQACNYTFPYTDPHSFVTLSSVLEGLGSSAYLGGAPLITSKDYLTVAGSILVAESLHTAVQRSAVGEIVSANPYGTSLDPTSVYTLAAGFIDSCPPSNPALPFKPFPSLSVVMDEKKMHSRGITISLLGGSEEHKEHMPEAPMLPSAGETVTLDAGMSIPEDSYVTFVSGLNVVSVKGETNGNTTSAAIPKEAQGQTYVFISCSDVEMKLDDGAILFGPAILEVAPPAPTSN